LAGAQVELQELSRTQQAFAVVDVGLDGNGTIDRIDARINARQFTDETLVAVAGTGDFHFLPGRQLAEVFFRYREHHLQLLQVIERGNDVAGLDVGALVDAAQPDYAGKG